MIAPGRNLKGLALRGHRLFASQRALPQCRVHLRFGFATGFEAVAMPRRNRPDLLRAMPWRFGLRPSDLLGHSRTRGIAQKWKGNRYGGA